MYVGQEDEVHDIYSFQPPILYFNMRNVPEIFYNPNGFMRICNNFSVHFDQTSIGVYVEDFNPGGLLEVLPIIWSFGYNNPHQQSWQVVGWITPDLS